MFCSRCGVQLEEGAKSCRACGREFGGSTTGSPTVAGIPGAAGAVSPSTPATFSYGGFWERFVAYLIDGLILGIPFGLVIIVLVFLFGGFGMMIHRNEMDPSAAAAIAAPMIASLFLGMVFFIVLQWLYFAVMESSERQATFGKSVMSLRVTNLEGQRISFGHATGRFFAKIVSGMIPLAIGYIMAAFTAKKQALHDMIAGTLVLRK